jgi:hypothetical protein
MRLIQWFRGNRDLAEKVRMLESDNKQLRVLADEKDKTIAVYRAMIAKIARTCEAG